MTLKGLHHVKKCAIISGLKNKLIKNKILIMVNNLFINIY